MKDTNNSLSSISKLYYTDTMLISSVESRVVKSTNSLVLPKGKYIIFGKAQFSADINGIRQGGISLLLNSNSGYGSPRTPVSGWTSIVDDFIKQDFQKDTTVYYNVYQSSGTTLNIIYSSLFAIRVQ